MTVNTSSSAKAVLRFLPNWQQAGEGAVWQSTTSGAVDVFGFDGEIYKGLTTTPVSPKPNAWLVQYCLYYMPCKAKLSRTQFSISLSHLMTRLPHCIVQAQAKSRRESITDGA